MVVSGAGYTSGFDKNPFAPFFTKKSPHIIATGPMDKYPMETERYQLLLEDITDKIPEQPRLHPTPDHFASVAALKQAPFITISPSSVWFTKRYPPERWIKLIELLPASHNIYILGGPGDKELGDTLVNGTNRTNVFNQCGTLSYLQSAALMKDAQMNYANDSAPLHFAGAMNAPVTGVFCSTISWLGFGPTHNGGRIVEIDYPLQCRPCGIHGRKSCPEGHFKCAYDIKDEQLLWWTSKTI
jgi:heptosyltransferase-2